MTFFSKQQNLSDLSVNNLRLGGTYIQGNVLVSGSNGVANWASSPGTPEILNADGAISINGVTLLDTSNSVLTMTLEDAQNYTTKTIRLLHQRGNNAIITFNMGTITLTPSNDNYSKELVFYGDAWHVVDGTITSFYPTIQQGSKLVGTGNVGASEAASAVSLSADGNTLAVGGPYDNTNEGATWIFTRTDGVWSQQGAKLVGTGNMGPAEQGWSVSLSADGNTLATGGWADNSQEGATWIFTRSAGVWTQQGAKLVGTGDVGAANQGISVSLSADGNTLAVGGPGDNPVPFVGATWIFTRTAGVWSQQGAKLAGTGNVGNSLQGTSISLSADGNTLAVGGYTDNTNEGAIWIFTRTAGLWTQQGAKLVGTGDVVPSRQGYSVSLSADGNTLASGGNVDNGDEGATWIFTRSAGVWTQQGSKLVGTGDNGATRQGFCVSLSGDGNTLASSGYKDNSDTGATWIFTRVAGTWSQQGSKLVGTGGVGTTRQGWAISLSSEGSTLAVGGYRDNSYIGATWIFI